MKATIDAGQVQKRSAPGVRITGGAYSNLRLAAAYHFRAIEANAVKAFVFLGAKVQLAPVGAGGPQGTRGPHLNKALLSSFSCSSIALL